MVVKAVVVLKPGHTGDAAMVQGLQDFVKAQRLRPTNTRVPSSSASNCRAPKPASCSASG